MRTFEINIATRDGDMNTFVAHPDGDAAYPAIFMYMPSSGVSDELRDMATRLAGHGYAVLLPNVYYRMVRVVDIDANRLFDADYTPVKLFMNALNDGYSNALSVSDTAAMIAFAKEQSYVKACGIGVVGYCMGGRLALSTIGAFQEQITAMASLYGGKLATEEPDSPHLTAAQITASFTSGSPKTTPTFPWKGMTLCASTWTGSAPTTEWKPTREPNTGLVFRNSIATPPTPTQDTGRRSQICSVERSRFRSNSSPLRPAAYAEYAHGLQGHRPEYAGRYA